SNGWLTRLREGYMVTQMGLRASVFAVLLASSGYAQWTGSGSNGTDGALVLTQPGRVLFDPGSFSPLTASHDNVYHFTSIYIANGVTREAVFRDVTRSRFLAISGGGADRRHDRPGWCRGL